MATISLNLNAKGVKQGAKEADQAFDKVKKSAKETESQVEKSNKKIGSSFSNMLVLLLLRNKLAALPYR